MYCAIVFIRISFHVNANTTQIMAHTNPIAPVSGIENNQKIAPSKYIAEPIDPILLISFDT